MTAPTALIADDEPLLREHLVAHLARLWPQLQVVAQARNGREAVELFESHRPTVVFLDIHMPGTNGIDAARAIGGRAHVVFVTAYDQYAVAAFEQGAIDYLVKPFEEERLAQTVLRLQERLAGAPPAQAALDEIVERLSQALAQGAPQRRPLRWIRASAGATVKLIPVEEVAYLKSDDKYTLVVWAGGEAVIRKSIRELVEELDPEVFVQVHRSVVVNLRQVAQVVRSPNETAELHLRGRGEVLPVSRSYLHLFRQM
jgi:DNA-binding LytR/AlgR family response regulator